MPTDVLDEIDEVRTAGDVVLPVAADEADVRPDALGRVPVPVAAVDDRHVVAQLDQSLDGARAEESVAAEHEDLPVESITGRTFGGSTVAPSRERRSNNLLSNSAI